MWKYIYIFTFFYCKYLIIMSKRTILLLTVLVVIVVSGLSIAYFYYGNINKNIDPRLMKTQEVLAHFDQINKLDSAFLAIDLMKNLEKELLEVALYKDSYEIGVVINNKASVYLMMALYGKDYENMKDSLFSLANTDLLKAKEIFENWIDKNKSINKTDLAQKLNNEYQKDIEIFKGRDIEDVVAQRIEDIDLAKIETPRRLSVVYSNIAIIKRHTENLDEAIKLYQKAIELWPKNHDAKNNLNVLCGKEREKRSVIDKMFPGKRKE